MFNKQIEHKVDYLLGKLDMLTHILYIALRDYFMQMLTIYVINNQYKILFDVW